MQIERTGSNEKGYVFRFSISDTINTSNIRISNFFSAFCDEKYLESKRAIPTFIMYAASTFSRANPEYAPIESSF